MATVEELNVRALTGSNVRAGCGHVTFVKDGEPTPLRCGLCGAPLVPFLRDPPPLDTSSVLRPRRQWVWQGALFVLGIVLGALFAVAVFAWMP